jgi:hypothetical protein
VAKYCLLALTNAVPGGDDDLNRWYDAQHVPDVLAVPGFASAQRFKVLAGFEGQLQWRYLTLYELDTETPAALMQDLGQRFGTPAMPVSPALHVESAGAVVLEAIGDRVER